MASGPVYPLSPSASNTASKSRWPLPGSRRWLSARCTCTMCSAWARSAAGIESSSMFMWKTFEGHQLHARRVDQPAQPFSIVERPEQVGLITVERLEGDDDPGGGRVVDCATDGLRRALELGVLAIRARLGTKRRNEDHIQGTERVRLLETEAQVIPGVASDPVAFVRAVAVGVAEADPAHR